MLCDRTDMCNLPKEVRQQPPHAGWITSGVCQPQPDRFIGQYGHIPDISVSVCILSDMCQYQNLSLQSLIQKKMLEGHILYKSISELFTPCLENPASARLYCQQHQVCRSALVCLRTLKTAQNPCQIFLIHPHWCAGTCLGTTIWHVYMFLCWCSLCLVPYMPMKMYIVHCIRARADCYLSIFFDK